MKELSNSNKSMQYRSKKNRILIIRPSSIGDVVMASPMLQVLKKAYPSSHIAWLLSPSFTDLLQSHPLVDDIIIWDKGTWTRLWKSGQIISLLKNMFAFMKELRAQNFDLVLEAQGLFRSRILAWMSGGKEKIGFESKEPGRFLLTKVISRGPRNKQMSSEYYQMMKELGITPQTPFKPLLAVPNERTRSANRKLLQAGIGKTYAVFCPFTTRPQKHWLENRWIDLSVRIREELHLPALILGGPEDHKSGDRIESLSHGAAINFAGKTSLGEAMAILKGSSLVIGVDTGLTHMGAAFDTPTVALFGATCPYLYTDAPSFAVIYHELPCSPCKRSPTCDGDFTCMRRIGVDEVLAISKKLTHIPT